MQAPNANYKKGRYMDVTKLQQLQSTLQSGTQWIQVWRPTTKHTIRILPGKVDSDVFYQGCGKHWISEDGKSKPITCSNDQNCIICKTIANWRTSPNVALQKAAQEMRVQRSFLVNGVERPQQTVIVMEIGPTAFRNIISLMLDPEYGDITDTKKGFDITIEKQGRGLNTEYIVRAARKETPLGFNFEKSQLTDLSTVYTPPDEGYIQRLLISVEANINNGTTTTTQQSTRLEKDEGKKLTPEMQARLEELKRATTK